MKKSNKLFIACSVAALAFAIVFSGYSPKQQKQLTNPFIIEKDQTLKTRGLPYHHGMITIKVKEGVGEFSKQSGVVSFNISSLDVLANKYEVNLLEKRFKFNPNKLKKGLPDLSRIYRISFPEEKNVHMVASAFNEDPNIEYAEPIPISTVVDIPDDVMYSQCQHLPQIMAPEAWDIHKGENGTEEIIIAIVDTGIDWDHEDLQSNVWQNLLEDADGDGQTMEYIAGEWVLDPDDINGFDDDNNGFIDDLIGWNFISNGNDPNPFVGNPLGYHGTHCAGISNGVTNNGTGIASISWNLSVMGICADANNTLPYGYDGIIYAAENGADFISNSWSELSYSLANHEVIDYVTGLGSVVLASTGNHNTEVIHYPASYPGVLSIASVSVDDTKASYSAFGPSVDISSPGGGNEGGILSTIPDNEYMLGSGTSMACPLVAGCFGLLKSYHPEWTNEQLITQIMGTTDDIDSINPDYQFLLGTGRVNALYMLTEENVTMPQEFKIVLTEADPQDENGNGINEPGEEVTLNFEFRNYVPYVGEDNATVIIQSEDPEIIILDGTATINIPPDGIFTIEDQLLIQVSEEANSHFADITIYFETNAPVVYGQDINFGLLVAPSGVFILDGNDLQTDLSGWFINEVAADLGISPTYSTHLPYGSLNAFDVVFLSFGNFGSNYIPFESDLAVAVYNYLVNGGRLYIEGGDALGWDQSANDSLHTCLGLVSVSDGSSSEKPVTHLEGQDGTLTEGMLFTQSSQSVNTYIDIFYPENNDDVAFIESSVGKVGIQHEGIYGQKTFCFSYALAALTDQNEFSNKYRLLTNIFEFFELPLEEGYLVADFGADPQYGLPPLDVQFTDWTISDPDNPANLWQWDFDNDGVIDSGEENPVWTYNESENFSVKLIVSNSINTDTILKENYIDTKAVPYGTWYVSESPYILNHDIVVPDEQTLIIEPGVEVIFTGHYRFKVFGQLLAEGTESDSIYFTALDTETGWHSLRLLADPATNDTSKLSYCIVQHGKATGGLESFDNMGGGILIWEANAIISNSTIRNNLAGGNGIYGAVGGGISIWSSNVLIQNCRIIHNEANSGGGLGIIWCNPIIKNCLIANNMLSISSPYWRESGGIVIYQSNSLIINNTIVNNIGGGMVTDNNADPTIINTISWGNNDGVSHNFYIGNIADSPEISYCDFQGGFDAIGGNGAGGNFNGIYENNIDADPLFIDPVNGDFHLTDGSPCIDAGDPEQPSDPDGTISDIGAFYYDQLTGVFEESTTISNLHLFPNPVNSNTSLNYVLSEETEIIIKILNLNGQLISVVLNEKQQKGPHSIIFDGSLISAGVYFCVLKTNEGIQTIKMIKL